MGELRWAVSPVLRTADAYNGESAVFIEATQLNVDRAFATRIVREWCDFFAAGPSPIEELGFISRPARLWNSLVGQTQLRVLHMKWGDYSDLSVLAQMRGLAELRLGSSPAVTSLEPLASLENLTTLEIENTWRVRDYSPLGRIAGLRHLTVRSGEGHTARADSIEFLRQLGELETLSWSPPVVSLDYSPVLDLDRVKKIRLSGQRGMSPSMTDLEWSVPGIQAAMARDPDAPDYHFVPVIEDGEFLGELRRNDDWTSTFHPADGSEPRDLDGLY